MLFRPAKQSDVPRIQKLTKDIWDGSDYLGSVIEGWITEGGVYVGEVEGAIVGVTRIKRNGPQELWLEGLRIDPALQGQGLGRLMHKAVMAELAKMHPTTVRWASADTNHSVPMAEPSGFRLILKQPFLFLRIEPAKQNQPLTDLLATNQARVAEPTEPGLVEYLLKICREDYAGLLCRGWQYIEATTARIEQLLQRSVVLVSGEPEQIRAAILLAPHPHAAGGVSLNLIAGSPEEVKRLVPVLPSLLQTTWRERENLEVIIPEQYLPLFLANGYEQPDFFASQVVFEMSI
jgi:GNAT superfamily N-acetyltransferase